MSGDDKKTDIKLTQIPLVDPWLYQPGKSYGVGGYRRASGWLYNEYVVELSDPVRLPWIYREMRESNPAIASMMYTIESIAGGVGWHVEPGRSGPVNDDGEPTETETDRSAAKFLESCVDDLGQPWQSVITDLLGCCTFGWAVNEITYKIRKGTKTDAFNYGSKCNDGLIGWGKIMPIAQVTRWTWNFVEDPDSPKYNEPAAIEQFAAPNWQRRHIPLDKCIHVTFKPYMGSPEGWSPLRAIYAVYRYSQNIQLVMAQGIDRDLIGYPVVYIPEEVILGNASGDPAYTSIYAQYVNLATKSRRDDAEGVVLPSSTYTDTNGNPTSIQKYRFELLTSGGGRQFDLVSVLNMLQTWILSTLAADLLSLGHDGTGSFALADVKNDSMKKGIESILGRIQEAINTQAVSKLFDLNSGAFQGIKELPRLVHDGVAERDASGLAEYLVKLKQAGVPVALDKGMLKFLYEKANIPLPSQEALDSAIEQAASINSQQPFQMNFTPYTTEDRKQPHVKKFSESKDIYKRKDSLIEEMDVSDEVLAILDEYGVFDEDDDEQEEHQGPKFVEPDEQTKVLG